MSSQLNNGKTPTICYIPGRERSYSRNKVILRGMHEANLNILDCSHPSKTCLRYIYSFAKFLRYHGRSDIVFIGFLGQFLVPFIRLFTRKKILFDAFVSVYQTLAFDRKSISPKGLLAKLSRYIDRRSCQLADAVVLDTNQHINYFVNQFHLPREKFSRLLVGSDDSTMFPRHSDENKSFLVHFHGAFQPLHGAEYIIEAAKLLPDIRFHLIGKGRTLKDCQTRCHTYELTNVKFSTPVPYEKLADVMSQASICLGLFGNTTKAKMVIPHKAYEAIAMEKALITSDTPAVKELFTHRENVYLCKAADPVSLVEAIKELKENSELRKNIAENGRELFHRKCSPKIIGQEIRELTQHLVES